MSENELLSKEEIDALLHGVGNGDIETETNEVFAGEVRAYDFSHQERIVRDSLPTLEVINERFARYFSTSLFNLLRRSADITVSSVQMLKFSEFVHSLSVPTSLNLIRVPPLRGKGLCVMDRKLIFSVVNNFFGGRGTSENKAEMRDFTPAELRVIHMLLELSFTDFKEAWKPVLDIDFEYIGSEVNPQFANIASPSEVVVVTNFYIELDTGGGDLRVCLPYLMIEPIRVLLEAGVQRDPDEHWEDMLHDEILNAKVELSGSMAEATLSIKELAKLEVGDIVPVDLHEMVDVFASEVPVFKGKMGISNGKYAVKVQEWRRGSKRPTLHDLLATPRSRRGRNQGKDHERK